jgi:putative ABC transport system permease protein
MSELRSPPRGGTRLAFRIARRNAVQAPGRSLLIVALIALPVIGLAGLATVVTSTVPTATENADAKLGQTQALVRIVSPPDESLVQSPDEPSYWHVDNDSNGPLNHKASDPYASPASFLPGVRLLSVTQTSITAKTALGTGTIVALEGNMWDPSLGGRYDLIAGHRPGSAQEIMVSPAALMRLGVTIGGTVSIILPKPQMFTVVGILQDASTVSGSQTVFGEPGAFDGLMPDSELTAATFYLPDTRVDWATVRRLNKMGATVLSRDVLLNLPPPSETRIPAQPANIPWTQLGIVVPLAGFTLFEVALLAGAAFAVGVRKQQAGLATIASVGGDRKMLFRVIAFGGLALGIVGGIVGAALGVLGAQIYIALTSDGSNTQYPGFHPNMLVLAGVVIFAAMAGLISAAIPARQASKVDVLAALRGSVRPQKITARRPLIGIVLASIGGGVTLTGGVIVAIPQAQGEVNNVEILAGLALVVVGPVLIQVGAILIAPLILNCLAILFARFGLGARLAYRDAARNAARSVPALAAIMTTVFVGSFVMTYNASSQAEEQATWDYWTAPNIAEANLTNWLPNGNAPTPADADKAATVMKSIFNVTSTRTLQASALPDRFITTALDDALFPSPMLVYSASCPQGVRSGFTNVAGNGGPCAKAPYTIEQRIWVGDASDLSTALGEPASASSRATLTAGGAVSLYPQYVDNGQTTIRFTPSVKIKEQNSDSKNVNPIRTVSLPATVQAPAHGYHFTIFITPETATKLGIAFAPSLVVADVGAPATTAQYDFLGVAATALSRADINGSSVFFRVEPGPPDAAGLAAWILLAICAIITLGAASIAIGLGRADGRRDEYVLCAAGASPRVRRSFGFWQAICLAGTGAIFGVILGVLPVLTLAVAGQNAGAGVLLFTPPTAQLVLAAIGVPLLIAIGSWTTAHGSRRTFESTGLTRS